MLAVNTIRVEHYSERSSRPTGPDRAFSRRRPMNVAKEELPTKLDSPSAVAQHQPDFGDATGYGSLAAERFTMAAGTDLAALLEGLEGDLCQSPHWGYVVSGALTVTYADGSEEVDEAGDVIYWPPGHTVRAEEDAEFVLFSPQHEHGAVLDHIEHKMDEGA
jgi:hypothetical protein